MVTLDEIKERVELFRKLGNKFFETINPAVYENLSDLARENYGKDVEFLLSLIEVLQKGNEQNA